MIFDLFVFDFREFAGFTLKFMITLTYVLITRLFREILPLMLSLFYVHLCLILSRLIELCREQLSFITNSCNLQYAVPCFIRNYKTLHELTSLTESALSLQVFWLLVAHFVMVFLWLSAILGFYQHEGGALSTEMQMFAPIVGFSLFSILFFASRINKEDDELRLRVKDVAFELSLRTETMDSSKLLLRFIESKQQLVFTAWSVFHFRKSFLFVCAGVLISYNLLILQLNQHSSDEFLEKRGHLCV
ncbi:hypothetical protein AVEN_57897-1 [Araneus ventricosus]|uniref:Gustatory receptor n=1 Tax=Araneus ventricosus TaxID=182803 RepID=A0A4Y2N4K9_ARAVE|nr:hypothetical protein AVEN_57897-1 [Araneus ventricosus]